MEKIEGIDLNQLVENSSAELVQDKRKQASNIIKNHLQRVEQLALDIRNAEKELKKKKEKLEKAQARINQIKEGNWSILSQKEDGPRGHNNSKN